MAGTEKFSDDAAVSRPMLL